jgi:nicotinamide mononucleotide adenylyltransferase
MKHALFIGRFQPFHTGHLDALYWAYNNFKKVVDDPKDALFHVVIGHSQDELNYKHFWDRVFVEKMINLCIGHLSPIKICIDHVKDINKPSDYGLRVFNVAGISRWEPKYIYSDNKSTLVCFKELDVTNSVEVPTFAKFNKRGTEIRLMITSYLLGIDTSTDFMQYIPAPCREMMTGWLNEQIDKKVQHVDL